jgi:phenylalanine-4-hydroxylase
MEKLPVHLRKYVVEQNYEKYTPVDHAVWRFILRQLKAFLSVHAHESYLEGLEKTGIEIEKIPSIDSISEKLKKFGWRAVPVSGFIPPAAFMELQALSVLPIASDIRSLDHLLYTPAPDIVHEAAGHAPILAHEEFASYLRQYAQVAKRAILSKEDLDLYEAIRTLSDLKEHPDSTQAQIKEAEDRLNRISKNITYISEGAELARMNWWTAEYGLIGSVDDPKIFGAGLLSSVGESRWCLSSKVKKIPLTVDCVKYTYDITEPQPQLFVTPDFKHLGKVLEDFAKTMAYRVGGLEGISKAIKAQSVNTAELDSGIQISGQIVEAITDSNKNIIYLRLQGPSQLSYHDQELAGHDTKYHAHGFGTPIGFLKKFPTTSPAQLTAAQWESLGDTFEFTSGVIVKGKLKNRLEKDGKTLVITLTEAKAEYNGRILFEPSWGNFDISLGAKVTSVFGGAADRQAYGEGADFVVAKVPQQKISEKDKQRHSIYSEIRKAREQKLQGKDLETSLQSQLAKLRADFTDDWLPYLEIYELCLARLPNSKLIAETQTELSRISKKYPEKADVIKDGIALAPQS